MAKEKVKEPLVEDPNMDKAIKGVIGVVTLWLMFWVVFSVFSVMEFFSDTLIGWVPFYWLMKCVFLLWCMSPLEGSSVIYHRVIRPYFLKHESAIDDAVRKGTQHANKIADAAMEKAKDYAA